MCAILGEGMTPTSLRKVLMSSADSLRALLRSTSQRLSSVRACKRVAGRSLGVRATFNATSTAVRVSACDMANGTTWSVTLTAADVKWFCGTPTNTLSALCAAVDIVDGAMCVFQRRSAQCPCPAPHMWTCVFVSSVLHRPLFQRNDANVPGAPDPYLYVFSRHASDCPPSAAGLMCLSAARRTDVTASVTASPSDDGGAAVLHVLFQATCVGADWRYSLPEPLHRFTVDVSPFTDGLHHATATAASMLRWRIAAPGSPAVLSLEQ